MKRSRTKDLAIRVAAQFVIAWVSDIQVRSIEVMPTRSMRIVLLRSAPRVKRSRSGRINLEVRDSRERYAMVRLSGAVANRKAWPKRRSMGHADRNAYHLQEGARILQPMTESSRELEAYINLLFVRIHDVLDDDQTWAAVTTLADHLRAERNISGRRAAAIIRRATS